MAFPGRKLFDDPSWCELARSLKLSTRELQVVQGVFDDQKESAIAAGLGISPHTVNTYLQRVYQKLNVFTRSQLIISVVATYLAFLTPRKHE